MTSDAAIPQLLSSPLCGLDDLVTITRHLEGGHWRSTCADASHSPPRVFKRRSPRRRQRSERACRPMVTRSWRDSASSMTFSPAWSLVSRQSDCGILDPLHRSLNRGASGE